MSLAVWIVFLIAVLLAVLYLWLWRHTPQYAVLAPQARIEEEPRAEEEPRTAEEPPPGAVE
ncbi:MAG: hypothetical protein ACM3XZ_06855 [Betaproteobacteria bacterium]